MQPYGARIIEASKIKINGGFEHEKIFSRYV